ncbi:hypothetical protein C0J52_08731 [Blattella germanica]|nr:hypothetical protein C0J52_08731 [Blattella germanica]
MQVQYKRKKNLIHRMKILRMKNNANSLPPSTDESNKCPSTSKSTAFTHRKPPMYSGPSRSHVCSNHFKRSRKRKLSFIASSSSSTGSESTSTGT